MLLLAAHQQVSTNSEAGAVDHVVTGPQTPSFRKASSSGDSVEVKGTIISKIPYYRGLYVGPVIKTLVKYAMVLWFDQYITLLNNVL